MENSKKRHRIGVFSLAKKTVQLLRSCVGVLFMYVVLFELFNTFAFSPLRRKLWSLSLRAVPDGYISDQNFIEVFKHPVVALAGLFAIVGVCLINLWQMSGMILCLEYAYQKKPVKFAGLIKGAVLQTGHVLNPKNWLFFLYLVVLLPCIDCNFSSDVFSDITIPEFIMDFIQSKTILMILSFVLFILILWLFLRYMFIPHCMILEKKSFKEARIKSDKLLHRNYIRSYIKVIIADSVAYLVFYVIPIGILIGLYFGLQKLTADFEYSTAVANSLLYDGFLPIATEFGSAFVKMFTFAILLIMFHDHCEFFGVETKIDIPEKYVKTEGKIRTLKGFIYAIFVLFFVGFSLCYFILVFTAQKDPEILSLLINRTQIAAHKGYSSKAPENTMPAFGLASEKECISYIELDVRETKDGVPVVVHDASLKAATGENIIVYDLTYDQLQEKIASYRFDAKEFPDARVPSLEEVLNQYAGTKDFLIEIKADKSTPKLPEKIVRLMEKYDIAKTSRIHSGNYDSLKAVKEANPDIACGLIIAVSTGGYADLPYADFFSVEHTYVSNAVIDQIHDRGKEIFVWTVNSQDSFEQVSRMDADTLITDFPEDAFAAIHDTDFELISEFYSLADAYFNLPFSIPESLDDIDNYSTDFNNEGDY